MSDEFFLVHSFAKHKDNKTDLFRIILKKYKDRYYIDFRLWFQVGEGTELRPTRKGIALSAELLPEVRKGIEELYKLRDKLRNEKETAKERPKAVRTT